MDTCHSCGRADSLRCSHCGATAVAGAASETTSVHDVFRAIRLERSGVAAVVTVFLACALGSMILWWPLSLPARGLGTIIPDGTCGGITPGSGRMYACSLGIAFLTALPPILLLGGLVLLRAHVARWIDALRQRAPSDAGFLVVPLATTVLFGVLWSGLHVNAPGGRGLVPQSVFPGLVATVAFALTHFSARIAPGLQRFLAWRHRLAAGVRWAAIVSVPLVLSFVLTRQERVTQPVLKEQIVALVTVLVGYLLLARFPNAARPSAVRE